MNFKAQEWKVFQATRIEKKYEIARDGWNADYVDPMTFLDMFYQIQHKIILDIIIQNMIIN